MEDINSIISKSKSKTSRSIKWDHIDMITCVYENGRILLEFINNILDVSRLENGKYTLLLSHIDLNLLFNKIRVIFQPLAQSTENEIIFNNKCSKSSIYADETKLLQVFINIIGNAIKFTKKGKINITISEDEFNENYLISIKDNGSGMVLKVQELDFIIQNC